jgi:hypothetical protein
MGRGGRKRKHAVEEEDDGRWKGKKEKRTGWFAEQRSK